MKCQIKVIKQVVDIFPKYQPKVGQIYDAHLSPSNKARGKSKWGAKAEFCIVDILGKKVVLRIGEYEIMRYCNG